MEKRQARRFNFLVPGVELEEFSTPVINKIILINIQYFVAWPLALMNVLIILEEIDIILRCTHLKWNTKFF